MFGKILKQQLSLIYHDRSIILFSVLAIVIGLSPFGQLTILRKSADMSQFLTSIFSPYTLCFGLFTISLIASLNTEKFRLNDFLITRTRTSITVSIIIRTGFIQLIIWLLWMCSSILTITLSGLGNLLILTRFEILILYFYVYLVLLLLSLVELFILTIIRSKIIAFTTAFGINCFDFYLSKIKINSLIYYFVTPKSLLGILVRSIIMVILTIVFTVSINKIIFKKEFLEVN
ncbi:hypothetical protein [Companilactobacillus baiquanensis]|uniref:ABC transporter permease n=1 Tax=Companilactobacillus baiquanensis TaxID=2486005 RepID=A0ABW1UTZ6_9LACO|nr:hypothetical protein [Companilactobacillus baiquanensis]